MFTAEAYERELKLGFLIIADHARRHFGDGTVEQLLGVKVDGELSEVPLSIVNLENVYTGLQLLLMYDFAFGRSGVEPSGDFEETALASFIGLVQPVWAYGDEAPWPKDPLSQRVLDAYRARVRLYTNDEEEAFFSVRELALLADITEGAVRNALSNKEVTSTKGASGVVVAREEARRWLSKKRGFRDPRNENEVFPEALSSAESVEMFLVRLAELPAAPEQAKKLRKEGWNGHLADIVEVAKKAGLDERRVALRLSELWIAESAREGR